MKFISSALKVFLAQIPLRRLSSPGKSTLEDFKLSLTLISKDKSWLLASRSTLADLACASDSGVADSSTFSLTLSVTHTLPFLFPV